MQRFFVNSPFLICLLAMGGILIAQEQPTAQQPQVLPINLYKLSKGLTVVNHPQLPFTSFKSAAGLKLELEKIYNANKVLANQTWGAVILPLTADGSVMRIDASQLHPVELPLPNGGSFKTDITVTKWTIFKPTDDVKSIAARVLTELVKPTAVAYSITAIPQIQRQPIR